MIGDLNCRTRLSDGSCSIDDVVFYAKRAGLSFLAIADRDTMDGVQRAEVLGRRYGVRVIPAVSLGCRDLASGRVVDILCYLPESPDRLQGLMNKALETRRRAGDQMVRLACRSYPLTPEHVARYSGGSKAIYPAHIVQSLLDLGYGVSYAALFRELFDPDCGSCAVRPRLPEVCSAIDVARSAGGLVVLAQPERDLALAAKLASEGMLDGLERFRPGIGSAAEEELDALAREFKLLRTGGSGFTGAWSASPSPLAGCVVPQNCIQEMFRRKKQLVCV